MCHSYSPVIGFNQGIHPFFQILQSRFTPNRTLVSSRPHTILYGNSPSFRFFIIIGIAESTGHYTCICKDSTIILKNILFYLFDRKTCEVFMRPAMIGYLMPIISHFLKSRPSHSCSVGNVLVILIYIRATDPKCSPKTSLFQLGNKKCIVFCQAIVKSIADSTSFILFISGNLHIPVCSRQIANTD